MPADPIAERLDLVALLGRQDGLDLGTDLREEDGPVAMHAAQFRRTRPDRGLIGRLGQDGVVQGAPRGGARLHLRLDLGRVGFQDRLDLALLVVGQVERPRDAAEDARRPVGMSPLLEGPGRQSARQQPGRGERQDPGAEQDGFADSLDAHEISLICRCEPFGLYP